MLSQQMRANKNLSKQRGRVVIHSHHTIFIPIIVYYQPTITFLLCFSAGDTQHNCQGTTHIFFCTKMNVNVAFIILIVANIYEAKVLFFFYIYTSRISIKSNMDATQSGIQGSTKKSIMMIIATISKREDVLCAQQPMTSPQTGFHEFKWTQAVFQFHIWSSSPGRLLSPVCNYISELQMQSVYLISANLFNISGHWSVLSCNGHTRKMVGN